jgi:hypothetical protein
MSAPLGALTSTLLLRLAGRIVPEVASAPAKTRRTLVETVNGALLLRPAIERWQVWALILALGILTAPLSQRWQDKTLRWFEGGPLTIFRVGLWGLKTLVFMGYYTQVTVIAGIHYTPSLHEGNERLHRIDGGGGG